MPSQFIAWLQSSMTMAIDASVAGLVLQIVGFDVTWGEPHPRARRWIDRRNVDLGQRDELLELAVFVDAEVLLRQTADGPPIPIEYGHVQPDKVDFGPEHRLLLWRRWRGRRLRLGRRSLCCRRDSEQCSGTQKHTRDEHDSAHDEHSGSAAGLDSLA